MSDTETLSPEVINSSSDTSVTKELTLADILKDNDLKSHPQIEKFINQPVDVLAKSYVHANTLVGKRVDQMSPEDIKEFNKKLGQPERSDDYVFSKESLLPQEKVRELKDKFHKAGLNQVSAEHMFNDLIESIKEQDKKVEIDTEALKEANVGKLVEKFGSSYKSMLDLIEQELLEQGGIELRNRVLDPVNMDHQLVDVFSKTVKEKRSTGILNASPTAPVAYTAVDAQMEIDMIKSSPEYRDAYRRRDLKALSVFDEKILKLLRVKNIRK